MKFNIPPAVCRAFDVFYENNFEAYLVGGCVRDFLMDKEPHDFDMATNALPEKTKELFKEYKVIETGIKHGTVTVIINSVPIEITTYRIDGDYFDNRRPENVRFTKDIKADLSRRDFTVNAIAYNLKNGLCDPFCGENDIKRGVIACVGESDKRFKEDGLRILRALRFSSVLGFDIEEDTKLSIHKNKELLFNISKERIFSELKKLFLGKNVKNVLEEYRDVFKYLIPEISLNEKTVKLIENGDFSEEESFACLFFYEEDRLKKAEATLKALKTSNDFKKNVLGILRCSGYKFINERKYIKHIIKKEGFYNVRGALSLIKAQSENKEFIDSVLFIVNDIFKNNECVFLKQLDLDGNDLLNLGFKGEEIKNALNYALDLVIDGKIFNEKTAIFKALEEKITKNDKN